MSTTIRGLSWDHPRGHAPLVAASDAWAHARGDVKVQWTRRSLKDFASGTLDRYIGRYDLVACDHPLIGRAVEEEWLTALPDFQDTAVGPSHASYQFAGHLWAVPVDAAALALAYRPDLIESPPGTFSDLLDLARTGRVSVPLSAFSAVAIYASFCAEAGVDPFGEHPGRSEALARIAELAPYTSNEGSVDLLRRLATTDDLVLASWVYGYSIYSREGAVGTCMRFAAAPASVPNEKPIPTLGGVGLGLLAGAPAAGSALDLIRHLTSSDVQRGLYAMAGGQPAHARAWDDPTLDSLTLEFFSSTRDSLENAYVRPNDAWFEQAQPRVGKLIQEFAQGRRDSQGTLEALTRLRKAAT